MSTRAGSVRALGFAPREISSLVNPSVVADHAEEAAFLWTLRGSATSAPHFKLKHLVKLDARVIAHLEGLRTAGQAAWDGVEPMLAELDEAVLRVASYVAFDLQDPAQMNRVLQLALSDPLLETALIGGVAWLEPDRATPSLERLCASRRSEHKRIGLAVLVRYRADVDRHIPQALQDPDPQLRAVAFRAIGDARRQSLLGACQRGLTDPDPVCRFWAARSLALYGDHAAAIAVWNTGRSLPGLEQEALDVALRCAEPRWGRDLVRSLAALPDGRRSAIHAVGAFGDPVTVPWLLDRMPEAPHARQAGDALSMITGVDLTYSDLTADAEGEEVDPRDDDLPLPDTDKVREWWAHHQSRFTGGQRYLAGEPVSAPAAERILRDGFQRQRRAAAFELAIRSNLPLFPVDARADWQQRLLA